MDFQKDILDRSFEKPVVVDFWASWCGPCRVLGPVIEQLAEEEADSWTLVKIDTEAHQDIAMKYRVMSIPNVKMFYRGEVVAEFAGALPRHAIQEWLRENLPDPGKKELDELLSHSDGVPDARFVEELKLYLSANENKKEARVTLAKHLVFSEPDEAAELISDVKIGDQEYDIAEDIRAIVLLYNGDFSDGTPVSKKLGAAREALFAGDFFAAIEKVIEAVVLDKNYQHEMPRKTAIALFHLWGDNNEVTKKYRRRFDMALY